MFLKVTDGLRMALFRYQEVLFLQTRQRSAPLAGNNHVKHHNARIGFEHAFRITGRCRGLALQGWSQQGAEQKDRLAG